jgi:hypothetical protein
VRLVFKCCWCDFHNECEWGMMGIATLNPSYDLNRILRPVISSA